MHPASRRHAAHAALTATLALSTAAAADEPHPMVGTWSGTWTRGDSSEITITHVDERGAVHGAYCHRYPKWHSLGVIELHPHDGTAATMVDNTVRFIVGSSEVAAKLEPDLETVVFSNRRAGAGADAKSVLAMTRIEASRCTAQYRAHTITEISGVGESLAERMPDHPDHALIGHWTGRDAETNLLVELSIAQIESNSAKGLFCNLWSPKAGYYYALDLNPNGFLAPATQRSLRFDVAAVAFDFELEHGTLWMTRDARGHTRTLTLEKTDTPTCAHRFIPSPVPEAFPPRRCPPQYAS